MAQKRATRPHDSKAALPFSNLYGALAAGSHVLGGAQSWDQAVHDVLSCRAGRRPTSIHVTRRSDWPDALRRWHGSHTKRRSSEIGFVSGNQHLYCADVFIGTRETVVLRCGLRQVRMFLEAPVVWSALQFILEECITELTRLVCRYRDR